MGVLDTVKGIASTCPCCTKFQKYEGFQQLIELKKSGVVIYLHRSNEVATRSREVVNNTSEDVYILHNMKNNNILTADVMAQLDINKIYCPRCRRIYEHAQKLFKETKSNDKRDVIGICDHCRLKARIQEPCNKCDEVIRKFLKAYHVQRESPSKDIKTWLAKVEDVINKTQQNVTSIKSVRRSKTEMDFDQLSHQRVSKTVRDLKTELMFHSKTTLSDTDITMTRKHSKTQTPRDQKVDNLEESLEPIYIFPRFTSSSSNTVQFHDFETNKKLDKPSHFDKDNESETLPIQLYTKDKMNEKDKKQEIRSELIFKERSKTEKTLHTIEKDSRIHNENEETITKEMQSITPLTLTIKNTDKNRAENDKSANSQKNVSTATKDRDKYTKSTLTDDLPKRKRKLFQESDILLEEKRDISTATDKLLLMKKQKSKKESQDTQKTKTDKESNKRHQDVITGTEDLFKDKQAQTIGKSDRIKQKDDLTSKKQKPHILDKEQQTNDLESSLKKRKTSYKAENMDLYRDIKQLKSKNPETLPLKATNKALIEETKNIKVKEKHDVVDMKEFKRLQDKHATDKEKELKQQRQADIELQKVKDAASKKVKEDTQAIDKFELKQSGPRAKTDDKPKRESKIQNKELKDQDKAKRESELTKLLRDKELTALKKLQDDQKKNKEKELKQQKQAEMELKKLAEVANKKEKEHTQPLLLAHLERTPSANTIYNENDFKIATENYNKELQSKRREIIIGDQITKYKQIPNSLPAGKQNVTPMLLPMYLDGSPLHSQSIDGETKKESEAKIHIVTEKVKTEAKDKVDPESTKGIIRYSLSDRTFIDKGWTMLPTEKVVRKMNVYRMRPAHPEFDWFEHNKNKRSMQYDTGEKLADFDDKGRGRWYYKSGQIALDYYDAEETNAQQRFVIYSSGEPDERGRSHPITILATFDYLGNGIVFDHGGKIRLKYNQTEGVVLDRSIGPVSHWKWHTLNDPPVLQQVMIDTQMALKDPNILKMGGPHDKKPRPDNEEMLAIEFDNFIKEKSKKLSQKFKPFQIKMKALKINEYFSLRVLDQATIYLIFRDGSTNLKLNIGMVLDHHEIVDTDTAEVGEVTNNLERFPARTDSLAELQRSVAYAQRYERNRTERERRLRPSEPCASADKLTSAISRPLRPPLRTVPTVSTCSTECKNRKPTNNLYYNSRLL